MTWGLPGQVPLRLVRRGTHYTAYVGEDGIHWSMIGEQNVSAGFRAERVGLLAVNGNQDTSEIPADFDYFHVLWAD